MTRSSMIWRMNFGSDQNSRWHPYDDCSPSSSFSRLLDEVDRDPTGIFWG